MSTVISRILKRACYPFKMVNGETVNIRALTINQLKEIEKFGTEHEANGYAIGCSLLSEDRELIFTPEPAESPREFGSRVLTALDVPLDVFHPLVEFIFKLSTEPSNHASEAIIKN